MPEHQTIEYKESWHDEFLKWICGYANAYGGKLYIGKNDDGEIVGLDDKDSKKLLEAIPNKITDTMGIVVDVNLLYENNNRKGIGQSYLKITGQNMGRYADTQITGNRFKTRGD